MQVNNNKGVTMSWLEYLPETSQPYPKWTYFSPSNYNSKLRDWGGLSPRSWLAGSRNFRPRVCVCLCVKGVSRMFLDSTCYQISMGGTSLGLALTRWYFKTPGAKRTRIMIVRLVLSSSYSSTKVGKIIDLRTRISQNMPALWDVDIP